MTVVDTIREGRETELSQLGSSKAIYALTEGEMETENVMRAVADRLEAAIDILQQWEGGDEAERFDDAVETLDESLGRITERLGEHNPDPTDPPEDVAFLRKLDIDEERVGGLVGHLFVTETLFTQAVGFFVGQADQEEADLFRDVGEDIEAVRIRTEDWIDSYESGGQRVNDAADGAVGAAYDEYV